MISDLLRYAFYLTLTATVLVGEIVALEEMYPTPHVEIAVVQ